MSCDTKGVLSDAELREIRVTALEHEQQHGVDECGCPCDVLRLLDEIERLQAQLKEIIREADARIAWEQEVTATVIAREPHGPKAT